jgi:hypothetical protein
MKYKVERLFQHVDLDHDLYSYISWNSLGEATIITQEDGCWCYAEDFFSVRKVLSFTVTEQEVL